MGQHRVEEKAKSSFAIYLMILVAIALLVGAYFLLFNKSDASRQSTTPPVMLSSQILAPQGVQNENTTLQLPDTNQTDSSNFPIAQPQANTENLFPQQQSETVLIQDSFIQNPDTNSETALTEAQQVEADEIAAIAALDSFTETALQVSDVPPLSNVDPLVKKNKARAQKVVQSSQQQVAAVETMHKVQEVPPANVYSPTPLNKNSVTTKSDSVITTEFIMNLAQFLVNKYVPAQFGGGKSELTLPILNEYYGTNLYGLVHDNGRTGVLAYAYTPTMIKMLKKLIAPQLKKQLEDAAKQKGLTEEQTTDMINIYGSYMVELGDAMLLLTKEPSLNTYVLAIIKNEHNVILGKESFAKTLFAFQNAKDTGENTDSYGPRMQAEARQIYIAKQQVENAHQQFRAALKAKKTNIDTNRNIFYLAQWLARRGDDETNTIAAQALIDYGTTLMLQ